MWLGDCWKLDKIFLKLRSKLVLVLLSSYISESFMQIQYQKLHYPGCVGHGVCRLHKFARGKFLQNPIFTLFQCLNISIFSFKVKVTCVYFSSAWCLLGRHSGLMGKRLWIWLQIQLTITVTVKVPAGGKMRESTASGSWENYCMLGEHIRVTTFFFK
jgi:hypothetical protein